MSSLSSDTLINPQDLFDITSNNSVSDGIQLGSLATTGDGRYYRWVLAGGTALVAGKVQQSAAEATGNENLTAVAAAIGATSLVSTSTVTVTANQYTGGYAIITTGTGVGYQYQIGSHAAFTSAAPTFSLVDPILVALDTTSRIDLVTNPYMNVIVCPASATGMPVGVAVTVTPSAYYGWLQVRGVANVLADGTVTVGTSVCTSASVAGAIKTNVAAGPYVGNAVTGIATTEYGAVHLTIS